VPTLLEDLNDFLNTGELKSVAVYNAIEKICERFKKEIRGNLLLVEQATATFLTEKLMVQGGIKYIVKKSEDDNEVLKTLHYLLKQHYHHLISEKNPDVQIIKDDFDYLIKQFPNMFIKETESPYNYRNRFLKSADVDIDYIINYPFGKYKNRNERLINIAGILHEQLDSKVFTDYSSIIDNLKKKLGVAEFSNAILFGNETDNDDENLENEQINDSFYDEEEDESEKSETLEEFYELYEFDEESAIYVAEYLKMLSNRQMQILMIVIREKYINKVSGDLAIFKKYYDVLGIRRQTFYNELNDIKYKRSMIFKKHELNDTEKQNFTKQLVNMVVNEEMNQDE